MMMNNVYLSNTFIVALSPVVVNEKKIGVFALP
jgi:hypothetical protein